MYFRKTFALIIAGTVLFFAGCEEKPTEPEKKVVPEVAVITAKTVQRDVVLTSEYTGKIVAVSQVDIVPRIRGFLEAIKYKDGSIVEKGDLLFTIQDFDYKVAVDKAKANFKSAQANEASSRTTYNSAIKTNEKVPGTVSENDIVLYKSKWDQAKANCESCLAQYREAVMQLSYTKIYAPWRGKISKALKTPGQLLDGTGPNPPVLCSLVSMDPIFVEFQISDRYFDYSLDQVYKHFGTGNPDNRKTNESDEDAATETPATAENKPVTPVTQKEQNVAVKDFSQDAEILFEAIDKEFSQPFIPNEEDVAPSAVLKDNTAYMKGNRRGKPIPFELTLSDDPNALVFKGSLNYNDNMIDSSTGSMTIRGVVSNPEYRLYPGHICTVKLDSELRKDAIVIEERAVCVDLTSKYVWVVDEKNEAHKRYIKAKDSFENGTLRIIEAYAEEKIAPDGTKLIKISGLKVGEAYLVEGMQNVREGSKVKAVEK